MNITLLANRDLASCIALNYLYQELDQHKLSVFLSSRVGSKALAQPLQQLKLVEQQWPNDVLFPLLHRVGTSSAELLGFDQLRDVLEGRLADLNNINEADGLATLKSTEPDVVLSIRYGVILKEAVLSVPEKGVLNLHSGLLPDYKGVMATFWALLNGEQRIGTTLHFIDDSSIDTGRIVGSTELAVQNDRSYLWHVMELYRDGCQLMADTVNTMNEGGEVIALAQEPGGNYYSFPEVADLDAFARQDWRLFDNADVIELHRRFLARE